MSECVSIVLFGLGRIIRIWGNNLHLHRWEHWLEKPWCTWVFNCF